MKKDNVALGGATLAAVAASLCCIGPVLFAVLGLGAFGAAAIFNSARPYLLAVAVLILAFGFYRTYFCRQQACAPGEACAANPNGKANRIMLWLASIAVLAFALAPYYVGRFTPKFVKPQQSAITTGDNARASAVETVTVEVEGMDCASCEAPIRAALEKTPGVSSADVSYERGNARVQFDSRQTDINRIKRAISATGYKTK